MFLEYLLDVVLYFLDFLLNLGFIFFLLLFLGFLEIEHLALHEGYWLFKNDLDYEYRYVLFGFEVHAGHGAMKFLLNVVDFSLEVELSILEAGDSLLN